MVFRDEAGREDDEKLPLIQLMRFNRSDTQVVTAKFGPKQKSEEIARQSRDVREVNDFATDYVSFAREEDEAYGTARQEEEAATFGGIDLDTSSKRNEEKAVSYNHKAGDLFKSSDINDLNMRKSDNYDRTKTLLR